MYIDVDKIPKFNTDGINLTEYISREFKWSEMFDGWKSISFFSFIITKEGVLEDVKLEIGMCPEIDREIIRAIKTSPKWIPGTKDNKPVNVKLYFSFSCAF
ncbi:energy transducer TonB [Anaerorhabdus sp.]|uniref:energy transducer TonB n=1 Tax=Anaerorhabdus sp. TaxID=1872524 RepID=UPI002FC8B870